MEKRTLTALVEVSIRIAIMKEGSEVETELPNEIQSIAQSDAGILRSFQSILMVQKQAVCH